MTAVPALLRQAAAGLGACGSGGAGTPAAAPRSEPFEDTYAIDHPASFPLKPKGIAPYRGGRRCVGMAQCALLIAPYAASMCALVRRNDRRALRRVGSGSIAHWNPFAKMRSGSMTKLQTPRPSVPAMSWPEFAT